MPLTDGQLGALAALAAALCWVFTSLAFAAAGRRVGPTAVNLIRILLAVVVLAAVHRLAFGTWAPRVDRAGRLMCLKAFDVTGAMAMTAEVGDFLRFPTAESFMAYVGLVPGVRQSGGTRQKGVGITKAGNSHCRHILIQAAWVIVRSPPRAGKRLREQWKGQRAWVVRHSQRAMTRLHKRYWYLVHRGKAPQEAITAVARELSGFVWAVMQPQEMPSALS